MLKTKWTGFKSLLQAKIVLTWKALCGAVCLAGLAVVLFNYYQMWEWTRDLKSQFESIENNNKEMKFKARQLIERLSTLEITANKLMVLSGVDEDSLGGRGGPRTDLVEKFYDEESLLNQLNSLEKKSFSLRGEFDELQEYYSSRNILLSSSPSILPVIGYPSDRFGMRKDPFTGKASFHPGIDFSAPLGMKVVATADGVTSFSGRQSNYGRLVILEHRFGLTTKYGHLRKMVVNPGQFVRKGEVIGYVGATGRATGPHLHYEVRLNGRALNPLRFLYEVD